MYMLESASYPFGFVRYFLIMKFLLVIYDLTALKKVLILQLRMERIFQLDYDL